jgi:REP element-mobilizing transposase RayT
MARPHNHHVAGATYYVILRGNADAPIFIDDMDRRSLKSIAARSVSRHGIRVHAFAWTEKEAHLIIQISHKPLSTIIQGIASQHARTLNRRHHRSGYVFRHPHRAVRIDPQLHLPAILFHMHHVADPDWSSHRAYAGEIHEPWITTSRLLKILSADASQARRIYAQLMQSESRQVPHTEHFFFQLAPRDPPRTSSCNARHTHPRRRRAFARRPSRVSGAHATAHTRSGTHCLARFP